jgi:molecular chaperone GrpE
MSEENNNEEIMQDAQDIVNNAEENLDQAMYDQADALSDRSRQRNEESDASDCPLPDEDIDLDASGAKEEVKVTYENVDYKDSLARLQAEFTNYKTRSQKEQERARNWGKQDAILALLPVMDEIYRAREHGELEPESPFGKIAQKFEDGLNKLGIVSFGAKGEEFDPQKHEALMNRDANDGDDMQDGQVLVDNVIEHGYELGGQMFRTAKVSTVTK